MKRVSGIVELAWTVELPDDPKLQHYEHTIADDVAVSAVIEYLPQTGGVYMFGNDVDEALVCLEIHEEDFEIEEDERDEKTK